MVYPSDFPSMSLWPSLSQIHDHLQVLRNLVCKCKSSVVQCVDHSENYYSVLVVNEVEVVKIYQLGIFTYYFQLLLLIVPFGSHYFYISFDLTMIFICAYLFYT